MTRGKRGSITFGSSAGNTKVTSIMSSHAAQRPTVIQNKFLPKRKTREDHYLSQPGSKRLNMITDESPILHSKGFDENQSLNIGAISIDNDINSTNFKGQKHLRFKKNGGTNNKKVIADIRDRQRATFSAFSMHNSTRGIKKK